MHVRPCFGGAKTGCYQDGGLWMLVRLLQMQQKAGGRQQGTCFMNHCHSDCFMQDLSLWVQVGCYQSEEDILAVLGFAGPSMTVL